MESNIITVPGIISDIDGVIVKASRALPGSTEAVKILKTALGDLNPEQFGAEKTTLPFVCLTNIGDATEEERAEALNISLGLKDTPFQILPSQMLLNYSCLRPVFESLKDKTVLISGLGEVARALESAGLQNYLTIDEYISLYPYISPSHPFTTKPATSEMIESIRKRLGVTEEQLLKEPWEIHAFFSMMSPDKWEDNIQVLCDLIGKRQRQSGSDTGDQQQIPVYFGTADLTFFTKYGPRIASGFFKECLELCYRKVFNKELVSEITGKPSRHGYEYSMKLLQKQTKYPISNYYMIGDNPQTDIRGASKLGIKTILVKSGVFGGKLENDPEDPADYVVESMYEAVKLILKIENIKTL